MRLTQSNLKEQMQFPIDVELNEIMGFQQTFMCKSADKILFDLDALQYNFYRLHKNERNLPKPLLKEDLFGFNKNNAFYGHIWGDLGRYLALARYYSKELNTTLEELYFTKQPHTLVFLESFNLLKMNYNPTSNEYEFDSYKKLLYI